MLGRPWDFGGGDSESVIQVQVNATTPPKGNTACYRTIIDNSYNCIKNQGLPDTPAMTASSWSHVRSQHDHDVL